MKRIITTCTILSAMFFGACTEEDTTSNIVQNPRTASENVEEKKLPKMEFETVLQTFGTISEGEVIEKTFKFTNTGEADLIVFNASSSCGCTVPSWPKEPIKPGESGEIKVQFNSDNKKAKIHKKVRITANTMPSDNVVAISGFVKGPSN